MTIGGYDESIECLGNSESRKNDKYDHLIDRVRQLVARTIKEQSITSYYQYDYDRFMRERWPVRRFLLKYSGSVEKAARAVLDRWTFIKSRRLRELKNDDFPREIFQVGAFFHYEADRTGRPTVYLKMDHHFFVKESSEVRSLFATKVLFDADDAAGERGYLIVADLRNLSLANIDLMFGLNLVSLYAHLPMTIVAALVIDLPFIARATMNICKRAMPADLRDCLISCSREDVFKYIHEDHVPPFLGGKCPRPHSGLAVVPSGLLSFAEYLAKRGNITDDRIEKIDKFYASVIDKLQVNS